MFFLQDCLDNARSQFSSWMSSSDPLAENPFDPDLKQSVWRVAIREGGKEEFEFLLDLLPQFTVQQDVQKALYGLAESTDVANLTYLLDLTIQV